MPIFPDDVRLRLRQSFPLVLRYIDLSTERDCLFKQGFKATEPDHIRVLSSYSGRYRHTIAGPVTTLAALDEQLCAMFLKDISLFELTVNGPGRIWVMFVNDNTGSGCCNVVLGAEEAPMTNEQCSGRIWKLA